MKLYGNGFGIRHLPNIVHESCVWQLIFQGHGFCCLHELSTDIWEAAFPYTAHSSLLQFSLDISKPWLWGGALPSPSVHCCFPNGAHGPPCGQSGICLSLLYQMGKDEGRGEIKGKKTSLLQVSASSKAFTTFLCFLNICFMQVLIPVYALSKAQSCLPTRCWSCDWAIQLPGTTWPWGAPGLRREKDRQQPPSTYTWAEWNTASCGLSYSLGGLGRTVAAEELAGLCYDWDFIFLVFSDVGYSRQMTNRWECISP